MVSTWQFVDSIAASPTVRLDLNSFVGGLVLASEPEVSPPQMRRVTTSSMLSDGELVPASAFANRVIKLPLQLISATSDAAANKLQLLARELVREPGNILRVTVASNPMFFRTFPAPDAVYQMMLKLPRVGQATLDIPCEPFGYGLEEVLSPVTVTNNPAAASNGMFLDITSPKGDIETPLSVTFTNGNSGLGGTGRIKSALSVRRRGTVASTPFFLQAEAMTMSIADTTVQANSASMSGAGSNFTRTTFSTSAAMTNRLQTTTKFPTTASVDARGQYRVYARVRQNTVGDVVDMRLLYGNTNIQIVGDTVRLPPDTGPSAPTIKYIDLSGSNPMQIPVGFDPITDGISGVELATEGLYLTVQAQRVSGSGTLDIDVLLFVPADDRLELITWPEIQSFSTDAFVADGGPRPTAYCLNNSNQITSVEPIKIEGGPGMMITPGRTNRLFFVKDVGITTSLTGAGNSITHTNTLTCSYFPRYVFPLKPVST